MKTIVAFLVINQIPELPRAAIQSALEYSDAEICIGYLNDVDIFGLDFSQRIHFQKLNSIQNQDFSGGYRDFSENQFYQIVQLKWQLLEYLLGSDYDLIVYTDLDVIWLRDPIKPICDSLTQNQDFSVLIQSFTTDPSEPRLCMGFVAFRNSEFSKKLVAECKQRHSNLILSNPKLGDDDVVTKYYVESDVKQNIQLLPQATFPVGSFLNLYTTKPVFPGLGSPQPYIFHLNYVVGLQNKRIMLRLLKRNYDSTIHTTGLSTWYVLLVLKRMRIILWNLKKAISS